MLLRTIDTLWVEHLTELDDMRRGIGLRGYAQQDPLNEFRKEAFRLYEELRGPHPPPGRDHDLPGHREARARRRAARRPGPAGSPRTPPAHRMPTARARRRTRDDDGCRPARRRRTRGRGAPAARGLGAARAASATPARPRCRRPARRSDGTAREMPGDAAASGGVRAGLHADRRADRAQRPVLVRFGPEVQEVSRGLTPQRRRPRAPVVVAGLAVAVVGGFAALRIWQQGDRDEQRPADAIVVLGAAQYDGRPSPVFEARLDHAIAL